MPRVACLRCRKKDWIGLDWIELNWEALLFVTETQNNKKKTNQENIIIPPRTATRTRNENLRNIISLVPFIFLLFTYLWIFLFFLSFFRFNSFRLQLWSFIKRIGGNFFSLSLVLFCFYFLLFPSYIFWFCWIGYSHRFQNVCFAFKINDRVYSIGRSSLINIMIWLIIIWKYKKHHSHTHSHSHRHRHWHRHRLSVLPNSGIGVKNGK